MPYLIREGVNRWNSFWFSEDESYLSKLAAFRIVFGLVLVFYFSTRLQDAGFLYSDTGILPSSYLKTLSLPGWSIFSGGESAGTLQLVHALLILSALSLALGFCTRLSALVGYVLALSFQHRNPIAIFGVDTISTFYLFYLIFSRAGERFSIDSMLRRRFFGKEPSRPNEWLRLLSHVAYRLMQIQLVIIYTYSGWEKIRGNSWWDGSAMWGVLSMGSIQRWDLSFAAHVPFALALIAYATVLWEIYFGVLICFEKIRPLVLSFGLMMHLGIIIFLNLPSFGALMISIYLLFIAPETLERALLSMRRPKGFVLPGS